MRFGVGGSLIFGGVALGLRKKSADGQNDLCEISSPCQGCSQFGGCNLPKRKSVNESEGWEGGSHVRK